ncbi:site-2 protease family protein [Oscillatoria sp. CS-180]|uniref:site-2 protease family protein n=1 Tax=Oscillatoria sp. CS-180 TaxID=3021720 RepID=UPI00232DCE3D|nr:site-2 protease family protein [Oscillatoria sp. CS-180]MDB9526079.1 site-2 protease family protein [Oscillatoria sp. CS-180]
MVTLLLLLVAIALLVWGFVRARPYGKIGIFAWLQSVVLMLPWLLFFGLFSLGIYFNLVGVLFMVLVSAGIYIYLGRRLRAMAPDTVTAQRLETLLTGDKTKDQETVSATDNLSQTPDAAAESMPSDSAAPDAQDTAQPNDSVKELTISADDQAALEGIFGVDTFFRTETVQYAQGAIFKGNLRGEPEETLAKLTELAEERLEGRYRLFLIEDAKTKPVVVALPKSADPKPLTPFQKGTAVVLALATLLTCLEASGILMGFDLLATPEQWKTALPFAIGIFVILAIHEVGHWIAAQRHDVKLSWPFFIPTWEIGSFGALTRIQSVLPNRSVLFDIALAGPAAGGLLSFGMLVLGLVISHPGSPFQLPVEFFQGSVLVGTLARVVLGSALTEPLVDIHPLVLVGWLGLIITALNLLPAGQLDGGRIVQSIYGRKIAGRATVITLIILTVASFANPLALYWAVLILFLQREQERPAMNELIEPDDARAALGLLALFLTLATLLPLTPSLAGRLGIG